MDSHEARLPEQAVFAEAFQHANPAARAGYIEAACGTDMALRQRVEALLRAAENAGDFLEEPPTGLSGDADSTRPVPKLISEMPGDKIGRYKLLERIGEGGCGVVYMAEQEEPVRRRVALQSCEERMRRRFKRPHFTGIIESAEAHHCFNRKKCGLLAVAFVTTRLVPVMTGGGVTVDQFVALKFVLAWRDDEIVGHSL